MPDGMRAFEELWAQYDARGGDLLYAYLAEHGPRRLLELQTELGVSPPFLSRLVIQGLDDGLLDDGSYDLSGEGRRRACLHKEAVPVESAVTREVLARLCPACDQQLSAEVSK